MDVFILTGRNCFHKPKPLDNRGVAWRYLTQGEAHLCLLGMPAAAAALSRVQTGSPCCELDWGWLYLTGAGLSFWILKETALTLSYTLAENTSCLPHCLIQHQGGSLGESASDTSRDAFKFAWELGLFLNWRIYWWLLPTRSWLFSNEGMLKTLEVHLRSVKECEHFCLFILPSLLFGVD